MASEPGRVLLAPKMQNADLPVTVRDALSALFHHVDSVPTGMTSHAADGDGYLRGLDGAGAQLIAAIKQLSEQASGADVRQTVLCVVDLLIDAIEAHPLSPGTAARLALRAGGLLEDVDGHRVGQAWQRLAFVLVPLTVTVAAAAAKFARAVADAPAVPASAGVFLCGRWLSQGAAHALRRARPSEHDAVQALDVLYLPAVAAWSRHPELLLSATTTSPLNSVAAVVASFVTTGAYWLHILLTAPCDLPCFLLVPEVGEAYTMRLSGTVDIGQLAVLLAAKLRVVLRRLGVPDSSPPEHVATFCGRGPQETPALPWRMRFRLRTPEQGVLLDGAHVRGDNGAKNRTTSGLSHWLHLHPPLPITAKVGLLARTDCDPTAECSTALVLYLTGPRLRGSMDTEDHPAIQCERQFPALAASIESLERFRGPDLPAWASQHMADFFNAAKASTTHSPSVTWASSAAPTECTEVRPTRV